MEQGHLEAEQICCEKREKGYTCQADERVQAGARVLVPDPVGVEYSAVALDVLRLERRGAATVVGSALRFCFGLDCHSSHWCHSSHY